VNKLDKKYTIMKANTGTIDRILRAVIGTGIIGLGIYFHTWWGLIGGIIFLSSVFSYCPIYTPFNINTKKEKLSAK